MEQKYHSLAEIFRNPPNEFRMMPFWFWNHEMVEKEVQRQIRDHNAHGIGGEFLHPRHGRLTPYMGQRWLENVEAAADECKDLDMPCFLYDEDNWPSGPAGGYITGPNHPDNLGKVLALFDENIFGAGTHVEYELDFNQIQQEAKFYAAIAIPTPPQYPDFSSVIDQLKDVTNCVKGNKFIWDVPGGETEWTVIFFAMLTTSYRSNMNGYIDILRKATVKDFIDFTHKKYVDWFIARGKGDYLGKVIPGIFTDEPSMAQVYGALGSILKTIIFTPEMPAKFKTMFNYDFNAVLISLFYETGPISAKHRCHFWTCATELYVNAFYKQIYEFCDQYKIRTTGHVNGEGSFPGQITQHGDFFKVFQYMHYGGVDQLTEEVRPDDLEELWSQTGNPYTGMANEMVLASKFASSAAHLLGKPRVLVEAWGTSSWDITMASAKRVNDFLIATGCDLFVPHSFNYSEDGYRKGDHPAAFNYQPYYKYWKQFADYNARLCAIFNAHTGVLVPEVMLFYPTKSFYAEMMPMHSASAGFIGRNYNHQADCLFRQQLDFELANEDLILGSTVNKNGTFTIRDETFRVLFLGATTCLGLEFAKWLRNYYQKGGKILATSLLPWKEENTGESEEIVAIIQEIFAQNAHEIKKNFEKQKDLGLKLFEHSNIAGGNAIFIQTASRDLWSQAYFPILEQAFRKLLPHPSRDVIVWRDQVSQRHAAYVMSMHKTTEGKELYFLANTSRTASYLIAKVLFNVAPHKVELWDALTGKMVSTTEYGVEGNRTSMHLNFPPYQSYVVVITPEKAGKVADRPIPVVNKAFASPAVHSIDLGSKWQLGLYGVNCAMLYKKWEASFEVEAGKAWGYRGFRTFQHKFLVEDLSSIKSVQLVVEGLVGDYGWCKSTIDMPVGGDRAHFTFPSNVAIKVNDKKVPIQFDFTPKFLDPCWIVADISSYLKAGENLVRMECQTHNHQTFHVVTDPWRLIGNFEVDESTEIPVLRKVPTTIQTGDLNTQGIARTHGGIGYKMEVLVPATFAGKRIRLEITNTIDCVEIVVNGKNFGPLWHAWQCEVTDSIKTGQKNTIELIYYGIAQNLLQTNLRPQGLAGPVVLKAYNP